MRFFLLLVLLISVGCARPASDAWTLADRPLPATVAADERTGGAFAAYARDGHVYVQHVSADGKLSQPVVVTPDSANAAVHAQAPAQVVVTPDGAVLVAWVKQISVPGRRFPASELRVARSDDGGQTFDAPFTANDGAGILTGHHFHDLLVAPDGTVYLSWLDGRKKDAARGPQAAPAEPHGGHGATPSSANGHGAMQHGTPGEPGTELRVARSRDGGRSFEPSVVVAEGTCECCRTALAVGPDGSVFVAWRHQFGPDVRDVAVARSDDGGQTFTAPVRLPAPAWNLEACPHAGPALAVAADGTVHTAWFTGAAEAPGLYYAVSTDGGQTFTGERIEAGGNIAQVQMAMQAGSPLLFWESAEPGELRLSRGTSRTAADTLGGRGPDVAVSQDAVWLIRQTDAETVLQRRAL